MPEKRHAYRWRAYTPPAPPLPPGVTREFIPTTSGDLELLCALPTSGTIKPPLLCIHGANMSAMCFIYWLPFFQEHGYATYSVSTRGHGQSWKPSLLSMTFTGKHTVALDVLAALHHVRKLQGKDPIVLAHSMGGALIQYILSQKLAEVSGMGLVAAAPLAGLSGIMENWRLIDPEMDSRVLKDWFHPRSMLSSTSLVHNAMFSKQCPSEEVKALEETMAEYESAATGLGFHGRYAEVKDVLEGITGMGLERGRKILLVAGADDVLVSREMVREHAQEFRRIEGVTEEAALDAVIEGSGHHLMRDVKWRECVELILKWMEGEKL